MSEIDAAIADFQRYLNTGMPAKVVSWDGGQLVTVRPMIRFIDVDGSEVTFPDIPDVLVQYPGGKGLVLTFPIEPGDECFVTFSQACIDSWYATGSIVEMLSTRRHDLSDGFAHFGFRSRPNVVPSVDKDAIALRTIGGSAFLKIYNDGRVVIDGAKLIVKCPAELEKTQLVKGAVTMDSTQLVKGSMTGQGGIAISGGDGASIAGSMKITGGDVTADNISLKNHKHPGVQAGGSDTGVAK